MCVRLCMGEDNNIIVLERRLTVFIIVSLSW